MVVLEDRLPRCINQVSEQGQIAAQRLGRAPVQKELRPVAWTQLRIPTHADQGWRAVEAEAPALRVVMLPAAATPSWSARFEAHGMRLVREASGARVAEVAFGSPAERVGVRAGDRLVAVERERGGPSVQWLYGLALALVAWVWRRQRRRLAIG